MIVATVILGSVRGSGSFSSGINSFHSGAILIFFEFCRHI